jgi:hypothetical protein
VTTLFHATLDGETVAYSSETTFLVQVARGRGSYTTRYTVVGNLSQAVVLYRGINVGHPYRKRLSWSGSSRPLARTISS